MATTIRGVSSGREKRGTSPSPSLLKKPYKPLSLTSTPSSSTKEKEKDAKHAPKYLKSTMSSSIDSTNNKPTLNRRRSFDRPPSTSQVQKVIHNVPSTRDAKSLRSSSFSHKTATFYPASSVSSTPPHRNATRTISALKESKVTTDPLKHPRSLNKKSTMSSSITPSANKGINGRLRPYPSLKKPSKSVTSDSSIDHDDPSIDLVNMDIDIEVQSLPEMSEMPDSNEELGDPAIIVTEKDIINSLHPAQMNLLPEAQINSQNAEELCGEQNPIVGEKNTIVEEQYSTFGHTEELIVETQPQPQNVDKHNLASEEHNMTIEEHNMTAESNELDIDDHNDGIPEITLAEEKKEEILKVKDEKHTAFKPVTAHSSIEKKDKQDYNDVIEETKNKLMGGKKNRVLALAGAFETVISLQDTTKN